MTKGLLVKKLFIIFYRFESMIRKAWAGTQADAWRQKLKQRRWRNTSQDFAFLTCAAQAHMPKVTTHNPSLISN